MRKKAYRYTKDDFIFVYQMLVLRSQGLSYPKIGLMFNKDHSTVIHWCRKFNVDVGKEVPTPEVFGLTVYKLPPKVTYRYQEIVEEPINRGKLTYAEYLAEEKRKSALTRNTNPS